MMEKAQIPYDTMSTTSTTSNSASLLGKCCCCIPLRIGCFILGYISLFVNTFRTIFFVGVTLYYGLETHGYTTVDDDTLRNEPSVRQQVMDEETVQILGWTLVIVTIFDLIWLAINIACLVGVHKKRPGPIRVFVGVASVRLLLTITGYMYAWSTVKGVNPHNIVAHCLDVTLTAYFIFVYYIYAIRLEEVAAVAAVVATLAQLPQVQIHDVSFIYPSKIDMKHLVL